MNQTKLAIIEDDEVTALNLKISLQKHGYQILFISNSPEDALEQLQTHTPDIAIIDISLRDSGDGIELAKTIKQNYNTRFIYLSSHSDENMIDLAKATNPEGYIVKPFNPESIHATIQMAVSRPENSNSTHKNDANTPKEILEDKAVEGIVQFHDNYKINLKSNEILFHNQPLDLNEIEKELIYLLVAHQGSVVSYEDATAYIKEQTGQNISVISAMWRLKLKLPDEDIIQAKDRVGYFIA